MKERKGMKETEENIETKWDETQDGESQGQKLTLLVTELKLG